MKRQIAASDNVWEYAFILYISKQVWSTDVASPGFATYKLKMVLTFSFRFKCIKLDRWKLFQVFICLSTL